MRPIWQELPPHFKRSVVELLDLPSRRHLRFCSHADKKLVDSAPLTLQNLEIAQKEEFGPILLKVDNFRKIFCDATEEVIERVEKIILNRNSKLFKLGKLEICSLMRNNQHFPIFLDEFSKRFTKLNVETFHWHSKSVDGFREVLSVIDKGNLKKIKVDDTFSDSSAYSNLFGNVPTLEIGMYRWRVQDVWSIIENFRASNFKPRSSFIIRSFERFQVSELFDLFPVPPENRSLNFARLHIQHFDLVDKESDKMLVVSIKFAHENSTMSSRVRGVICRRAFIQEDFPLHRQITVTDIED